MISLALTLVAAAIATAPQGGYTAENHVEFGIALQRPRDYEQVPTQPDEEHVVLYYTCKDKDEFTRTPPSLSVVWIDWVADPAPVAPPATPQGETGTKSAEKAPAGPPPPITTLARFLEQRTPWELSGTTPAKERDGYVATVHELTPRKGLREQVARKSAWCYAFTRDKQRAIAFVGECDTEDLEAHSKIWRYIAEHTKFTDPVDTSSASIAAKYASSKLRGIDYRVGVRSKLVRGWKAEDTPNFIVVYHTKDQPLLRKLLTDLEAIREKYVELFPPQGEITAVSTVRVCKDRAEYLAYGGWEASAGYWNSQTEELVFFDAAADNKRERSEGREDTLSVLYHEAFHQYIHYSSGELPPHSWFNEGHGDFFAGARVSGGKVKKIGPFDWRVGLIKGAVERGQAVPWKDIIRFEQHEYYQPDRVGLCYAQGWSMVYFLRMSPKAKKHPLWSKILDTYFVELKSEYARKLGELKQAGGADEPLSRHEAGKAAREHAVSRAFADIDLVELEDAWTEYVTSIEVRD